MAFKPTKPFLTYHDQINNLIQKKLLIINDTNYATSKLKSIGYYSLIDGYKNLFYNPMTRQYEPNTTFEDIVALYDFDQNLRSLILQYICKIEQNIRSLISYHFCETHSEKQTDYLNPNNYNNTKKHHTGIQTLIKILSTEANISIEHAYVVYQRTTYGNVPLWVILNTLTFGQTSTLYSFLTTSIQSKISTNFSNVNEKELSQYLKFLTHYRNICAHNERLFAFKSRYEIPDTTLHRKLSIPKKGNQYICGKSDIFAIMIAFRYLLNIDDFKQYKKSFSKLITNFEKQSSTLHKTKLLATMGLPNNWSSITRYKP